MAQDRGSLDAADSWYRESLQIAEALGHRLDIANNYHQLGTLAMKRGNLDAAED